MRAFVIGDPQGPFAKMLEVLDRHGAIAGDRLAPDVVLVSIGDHFDYDHRNPAPAAQEGLRLLRWLADHDPAQVHLLLGNHDAARVMELAALSDDEFVRARTLDRDAFRAAFPKLPPHGVIARDYASFTTAQRALVQDLLLAGRYHLALAATLADGRAALLTHAGVTVAELALLALSDERDPRPIAARLDAHLAEAIDAVRAPWQRGELAPLSLEPLHHTGRDQREGGGLLYHRPSNPARYDDIARASLFSLTSLRRFDPRTLPVGLVQVAGHSGHAKCLEELEGWATPAAAARARGGIRTLRVEGDQVTYDLGVLPRADLVADLILVDGELRRVPAAEVDLLELAAVGSP